MKALRQFLKMLTIAIFSAAIAFSGCSQNDPVSPMSDTGAVINRLDKGNGGGNGKGKGNVNNNGISNDANIQFPVYESKTFRYVPGIGGYRGGEILFGEDGRSKFKLEDNALTPPPGTPFGADVTITVEVDYDSTRNEFIFTFEPHGCQFSPRAEIRLDFRTMDVEIPDLYYIDDDGNYILQQPDQIEVNKRWMFIKVDHFSRYALAHS